jgi:type II secretory pathway pseudopilin PulG
MRKFILFIILVSFLGTYAYAGENQDKRKRKAQERQAQYRQQQEELAKAKARDLNAEDELYREIKTQERLLSQLRRKLFSLHEYNLKKYGQQRFPQDQLEYIEKYQEFPRDRY